jgi:cytochrome P450
MSLSSLLVALVAIAVLYRYVIYPALLSPLAKIPAAHPTAAYAPLWFWWTRYNDRQAGSLVEAHRRKGPVLRVEPNHVHLASQDALRVIYHVGRFDRDDWFTQFRPYNGTPNMLTFLSSKPHATRRRIMSLIYSKSYIMGSVDFQRLSQVMVFDRLLPVFDDAAKTGGSVDIFGLMVAMSAEVISLYEFGPANCMNIVSLGREKERNEYLHAGWTKILEKRGLKKATKYLEDQILDMCHATEDYLANNKAKPNDETAPSTYPVAYAQLREAIPKKEGTSSPEQTMLLIAAELIDNIEAARVGIGGALVYVFHELTQHPATLTALRAELQTLNGAVEYPSTNDRVSGAVLRAIDALPLLGAVVTETLRVRNPIRMPFRRVVPAGGATVDGFGIPAGTTVSASSHTMNMNEHAFPEPERWVPERWLGLEDDGGGDAGDAEKGARGENDPRRWFWTFLSGSRMCIGNNFSLIGEWCGNLSGLMLTRDSDEVGCGGGVCEL